jgi:hypothetical protein
MVAVIESLGLNRRRRPNTTVAALLGLNRRVRHRGPFKRLARGPAGAGSGARGASRRYLKFPKCATAAPVSVPVPLGGRIRRLVAGLVEQGRRVGGAGGQRGNHRRIAGQRHVADMGLALWRDVVVVADRRRSWANWCMGFCLTRQAGRHHGAAHGMRGANWCMGFWCRRQLRAPRGYRTWASCLACAPCSGTLAAECGTRGSKKDLRRCTLMRADWPQAARKVPGPFRNLSSAALPRHPRSIRVHLRASASDLREVFPALACDARPQRSEAQRATTADATAAYAR